MMFMFSLQTTVQDVLDNHTLISYISYAQKYIHPQLTDEAAEQLTRGYVEMRRRGNFAGSSKKVLKVLFSNKISFLLKIRCSPQVITATPRQIESLIRLSEALARIRFSEKVCR